jgi:hypothetical protein
MHLAAAEEYYGDRIGNYACETLSAPVIMHFGKQDTQADSTTKRNGNTGDRWMGWGSIQEA